MYIWGTSTHFNKTGILTVFALTVILFIYIFSNNTIKQTNPLSDQINLKNVLKEAIAAARNGGVEVVAATKSDLIVTSKGKTKEGLEDSVTNADLKSHCAMVKTLRSAFPNLHVVSEEKEVKCDDTKETIIHLKTDTFEQIEDYFIKQKDITVWIDPLDATHEYKEKLYEYVTTMVCVAVRGEPVIGVIHNPFAKTTSWAWVGAGVSTDLRHIQLLNIGDKIVVTVSRSHAGKVKEVLQKKFDQQNLEIKVAAGAGYKVLQVAKGEANAYVHLTRIKKWDICAGNAILNALGGKMTTTKNEKINYANAEDAINEDGLVATLNSHKIFIQKLNLL